MGDPASSGDAAAPAAGGQVTDPGSTGSDSGSSAAGGTPPADPGGSPPAQPLSPEVVNVLKTVRGELSAAKQRAADLEAKLNDAQRQQYQSQPVPPAAPAVPQNQPAPPAPPVDPLDGVGDDEVVFAKDVRRVLQSLQQSAQPPNVEGVVGPIANRLAMLELQLQDNNYVSTIQTYLPDLLNERPDLRSVIEASPNKLQTALSIARLSPKYIAAQQQAAASKEEQNAPPPDVLAQLQQMIDNSSLPGSPGGASGGGGSAGSGFGAKDWSKATDEEVDAEIARVMGTAGR